MIQHGPEGALPPVEEMIDRVCLRLMGESSRTGLYVSSQRNQGFTIGAAPGSPEVGFLAYLPKSRADEIRADGILVYDQTGRGFAISEPQLPGLVQLAEGLRGSIKTRINKDTETMTQAMLRMVAARTAPAVWAELGVMAEAAPVPVLWGWLKKAVLRVLLGPKALALLGTLNSALFFLVVLIKIGEHVLPDHKEALKSLSETLDSADRWIP